MPEHVTIVGDGAMATVCSILLAAGGHSVRMWGAFEESIERLLQNRENQRFLPGVRVPPGVELTANDDCFADTTLILSAVPTQFMRSTWSRLASYAPSGVPIVSVAKGIEVGTLLRPTQIIHEVLKSSGSRVQGSDEGSGFRVQGSDNPADAKPSFLNPEPRTLNPPKPRTLNPSNPVATLSGPNIAAELARYLPGTAVAAAADPALADRVQAAFSTQWFRVYTNADVIGVELAGATKNVIAIAAGILDGLGAGNNAKAALVTRGLVEITRLGVALGADQETFNGLAGLGDLITTCVSPEGRNRTVGERIGKGMKLADILSKMDSVAEGVPTTQSVRELARRGKVEMPITEAVYSVLFEDKDVLHALTDLMTRDPKPEHAGNKMRH